jgi:hypothetical protein
MTAQNTKPALPVISVTQEANILDALRILHGTVRDYGTTALPDFDAAAQDASERERIAARALRALLALASHRKESAVAQYRMGVKNVIQSYLDEARKAKAAFDALPDAVRSFVPPFPSTVSIPVESFADVFGNASTEQVVKALHAIGAGKVKKSDKQFSVVVEVAGK